MAEIGVASDAVDTGRRRERRVHQHHGRPDIAQPVRDRLGVERGDDGLGEQLRQQPRPDVRANSLRWSAPTARNRPAHTAPSPPACPCRTRAPARRRPAGWRRPGARHRRAAAAWRIAGAGPVPRSAWCARAPARRRPPASPACGAAHPMLPAGVPAHAPAVTLHEDARQAAFGGLVGVLPDPAALGVGRAERRASWRSRRAAASRGRPASSTGSRVWAAANSASPADRAGRRFGRRVGGERGNGRTREGVRRRGGRRAWQAPCWKGPGSLAARDGSSRTSPAGLSSGRLAGLRTARCASAEPDGIDGRIATGSGQRRESSGGSVVAGENTWCRCPEASAESFSVGSKGPGIHAWTISSTASPEVWCAYSERSWL